MAVIHGTWRYVGSSTTLVTRSHLSPFGRVRTSQYSVKTVLALYGTPFLRKYPGRNWVVTDFIDPKRSPPCPRPPAAAIHCAADTPCQLGAAEVAGLRNWNNRVCMP